MKHDEPHLRFAVLATDTALFTLKDGELYVRLIDVDRPPHFVNIPGLPGGLLHPTETAEEAAKRNIKVKAGIDPKKAHFEQLYTFSTVDRDPRGRVVAVAHLALVPWEDLSEKEQSSTPDMRWVSVKKAASLAYDHDEILHVALDRLASRVTYSTLISKIMPSEFTLTDLEQAYESIIKTNLDKRNFRKKILKLKILTKLPHKRSGGRFRPAQLFRFASTKVAEIETL